MASRLPSVRLLRLGLLVPAALAAAATAVVPSGAAAAPAESDWARQVLETAQVKGGLVVHLGCGDGRRTAALRATESYLVHGLDADGDKVRQARALLRTAGVYGPVSVDRFDGRRLPYADNLVNLLVAEALGGVSLEEAMRVLAPGGVLCVGGDGAWEKTVKPRPGEIDEWTHFLHGPTNNAVAADAAVGPPHQLQWVGLPPWARSHDHLASVSAVVCAGGRLFYIVDEGPIAAVGLDPRWRLVACDAFSGVVLWKRPLDGWEWHLRGFRSGPSEIARRLVAAGDRVYVTLGTGAPLCELDGATGRTLRTYAGTEGTLEVILDEGTLYVVAGERTADQQPPKPERPGWTQVRSQRPPYLEAPPSKRLLAIDAASGRPLWQKDDAATAELMPTTLAAHARRVYFQDPDAVVCLEAADGKEVWRAERPTSRTRPAWSAPTLVVYGDVVLSADRAAAPGALPKDAPKTPDEPRRDESAEPGRTRKVEWYVSSAGGQSPPGELIAFSAATGERLWNCPCRECYNAPVDVLVAGGLVWTGDMVTARDPGITEGRDPKTGEVRRTRPRDQEFFTPGMSHQRCYRNKATTRWLVLGRSGVEFIDVATGGAVAHHWTRGTCQYGVVPCNGLLYAPPHSCACFIAAKLSGFNCFAPKGAYEAATAQPGPRLEQHLPSPIGRGVGGEGGLLPSPVSGEGPGVRAADDWPTYRHDAARSGRATTDVPAGVKPSWQADLGGRLTSVVVAEGKVLVAQIDAHTVHALDAKDGRPLWSFTAGGRVDSPPTVWEGLALFGSADGYVYGLRAADGALAWRFRAAPDDRRIVACAQVESAWPVPGTVLVHEGTAYCAAGRSSYLDGGMRLCRLDARTGRLLSETPIDHRDPRTGAQRNEQIQGTNMPGALPDVLACDGASVYLRHLRFDLAGAPQPADVPHLFSPAGFLDDSWWHRTYWLVGTTMGSGYGGWPNAGNRAPAGRLLVLDGDWVYGFGRSQYGHTGAHVGIDSATVFHFGPDRDEGRRGTYYQAFAIAREAPLAKPLPKAKAQAGAEAKPKAKAKPAGREAPPPKEYRWTARLPILARAMVLAGDHLFLAGPPDILASDDPHGALEGRRGGAIVVLSGADGRMLAEHALESPPVFDGMAAARGALYLSTAGGKVVCLRGAE